MPLAPNFYHTSWVTTGKLLNLSVSQFPFPYNGNNNGTCLMALEKKINELLCRKLTTGLAQSVIKHFLVLFKIESIAKQNHYV